MSFAIEQRAVRGNYFSCRSAELPVHGERGVGASGGTTGIGSGCASAPRVNGSSLTGFLIGKHADQPSGSKSGNGREYGTKKLTRRGDSPMRVRWRIAPRTRYWEQLASAHRRIAPMSGGSQRTLKTRREAAGSKRSAGDSCWASPINIATMAATTSAAQSTGNTAMVLRTTLLTETYWRR